MYRVLSALCMYPRRLSPHPTAPVVRTASVPQGHPIIAHQFIGGMPYPKAIKSRRDGRSQCHRAWNTGTWNTGTGIQGHGIQGQVIYFPLPPAISASGLAVGGCACGRVGLSDMPVRRNEDIPPPIPPVGEMVWPYQRHQPGNARHRSPSLHQALFRRARQTPACPRKRFVPPRPHRRRADYPGSHERPGSFGLRQALPLWISARKQRVPPNAVQNICSLFFSAV